MLPPTANAWPNNRVINCGASTIIGSDTSVAAISVKLTRRRESSVRSAESLSRATFGSAASAIAPPISGANSVQSHRDNVDPKLL